MGKEHTIDNTQHLEDVGTAMQIRVKPDTNPVTISVWCNGEMVHGPVAALQREHLKWWASGFNTAMEYLSRGESGRGKAQEIKESVEEALEEVTEGHNE